MEFSLELSEHFWKIFTTAYVVTVAFTMFIFLVGKGDVKSDKEKAGKTYSGPAFFFTVLWYVGLFATSVLVVIEVWQE